MSDFLKRFMTVTDVVILALATYLFLTFDYGNLSTMNIIYIVVFGLWLVMFFVRMFIAHKNGGQK